LDLSSNVVLTDAVCVADACEMRRVDSPTGKLKSVQAKQPQAGLFGLGDGLVSQDLVDHEALADMARLKIFRQSDRELGTLFCGSGSGSKDPVNDCALD
jgi:hypothetical protein